MLSLILCSFYAHLGDPSWVLALEILKKNVQDDVGFKMTSNYKKLEFGAHMYLCKTLMELHLS